MSLTFEQLSKANLKRCVSSFHPLNEWTPSDWATATAGEIGEACNVQKKMRRISPVPTSEVRHDIWEGSDVDNEYSKLHQQLADEMADAAIYLDLWASRMGINLADAIVNKFNRDSAKVESNVTLP